MLSPRDLRRANYHAAAAECQRRGLVLGYWPGDEEFSGELPLPLRPLPAATIDAPRSPVSSPSERHLRLVQQVEGDKP